MCSGALDVNDDGWMLAVLVSLFVFVGSAVVHARHGCVGVAVRRGGGELTLDGLSAGPSSTEAACNESATDPRGEDTRKVELGWYVTSYRGGLG